MRRARTSLQVITIVQRVSRAAVAVDGETVGAIDRGLLLLVGVERGDTERDADVTGARLLKLRCFPGRTPMDLSVCDIQGGCLVISQFTLAAQLEKGNRPSFTHAEDPEPARILYERVANGIASAGITTATGSFGATMAVELVNDGPVTFVFTVRDGKVATNRAPTAC